MLLCLVCVSALFALCRVPAVSRRAALAGPSWGCVGSTSSLLTFWRTVRALLSDIEHTALLSAVALMGSPFYVTVSVTVFFLLESQI